MQETSDRIDNFSLVGYASKKVLFSVIYDVKTNNSHILLNLLTVRFPNDSAKSVYADIGVL